MANTNIRTSLCSVHNCTKTYKRYGTLASVHYKLTPAKIISNCPGRKWLFCNWCLDPGLPQIISVLLNCK